MPNWIDDDSGYLGEKDESYHEWKRRIKERIKREDREEKERHCVWESEENNRCVDRMIRGDK